MRNLKRMSTLSLLLALLLTLTACGGGANAPEETNNTTENNLNKEAVGNAENEENKVIENNLNKEAVENVENEENKATKDTGSIVEGVDYIVGDGEDYKNVPSGYEMLTEEEITKGWETIVASNFYELSFTDVKKIYGDKAPVYWEYKNPGNDKVMTMYWYAEGAEGQLLSAWVKFNTPNGLENSSCSMVGSNNI